MSRNRISSFGRLQQDKTIGMVVCHLLVLALRPVEASRLLLICEENADRFCSMGAFPLLARRNICCGCTRAVGIGANRTSTKIYEYAP